MFILVFIAALVGVQPAAPVQADAGWSAYNDCVWVSGQVNNNVTTYDCSANVSASKLKNFATGADTAASVRVVVSKVNKSTDHGADTNEGTDAYNTFHGIVDLAGAVNYTNVSGWYVELRFSGLSSGKTYTFATTANRADSSYDRKTKFTISDISSATNASTPGSTQTTTTTTFNTGYNTENGYVARWTEIQPGSDNDFTVRFEAGGSDNYGYGPSAFLLQEESSDPGITTAGTLAGFAGTAGVVSDTQSYTVSGKNLSGPINITAPADFQVSQSSGSGFGSSLSLAPTGGKVSSTTIYVRFLRATAGTSSGTITNSATGAADKTLAVSGTAVAEMTAYNDCSWASGQISTNITTYDCDASGSSGVLKNYHNGSRSGITAAFTSSDSNTYTDGAETAAGTDAYQVFHGIADMKGNIKLNAAASYVEVTLSGLADGKTYTFVTATNRDNSSYTNRITKYTLSGVDAATNASTSGVVSDYVTSINTYNTVNGYAARWTGIQAGSDHTFKVRYEVDSSGDTIAYGPNVFMLQEESLVPTITTSSSALSAFSSEPGVDSAEQSYTVSGSNLTAGITITAPGDFKISTTSGSGFVTSLTLPLSGSKVNATPVYVHFNRASAGTSSGDVTHTSAGAASKNVDVTGTAAVVDDPPAQPALVEPADNATGVNTSPALKVTVSDPDSSSMNVTFYGRKAGAGTGQNFTLIALPDTQNYATSYPATLTAQTQWIVDNKTVENIVWVAGEGDLVNSNNNETEYGRVDAAMDLLDTGSVSYGTVPGNHDSSIPDASTANYNKYFGLTRYQGKSYWGGSYSAGNNNNNYMLFSASGMDFIVFNLEYQPATAVTDWVDNLLKTTYSSRRAIVATHSIIDDSGAWTYQKVYNDLKDNPNLFLMLCGHMHNSDGEATLTLTDSGHTIYILQADYQSLTNGGNGYLRKMLFSPSQDKISVSTYSPTVPGNKTGNADDAFDLSYAMEAAPAFTELGTVSGVASGGEASFSWNELDASTEYEWYVKVTDGVNTTTGSTWSFTTGAAVNHAPELAAIGNKSVAELAALSFTATATDVDKPAQTLTFSLEAGKAGAVPAGAAITADGGVFTWTPTEAQGPGSYTFDVCVSDGKASDCETITVEVTEVNVAPELASIGGKSVAELAGLSFTATATDADLPANTLIFSLEAGKAGAVPAGAAITADGGVFTWTPTEAQGPGSYTFDVCVGDGKASDCETITVEVTEVNVAPELASIGGKSVAELAALSFTATATDADLPANTLTFSLAAGTAGAVPAGAAITADGGVFTWTPAEAQGPGSYTFDVCASDGTASDCETITVEVTEVNVAPELASIGGKTAAELTPLSFTATATDADLPANTLTFSLAAGTAGAVPAGAAITADGGVFTWTPAEAQGPGSYTFDVCVGDGTASDCETITVEVTEVNVAPELASIGGKTAAELTPLSFTATATDADLPANPLTFSLAAGTAGAVPAGAAITADGGVFTWTPTEAQGPGSYTFDVCVSDGKASDCETVTVEVTEVNVAPELASIGGKSVAELAGLSFTATATDADLPANTLTFSLEAGKAGAVPAGAAITADGGVFTWTPTEAQGPGSYTFDVCVGDGKASDCETITVEVTEVNVAPELASIGGKTAAELTPLSFTATATDADKPDNPLTFSLEAGKAGAVPAGATITPGGVFTWTPDNTQGGATYTFDVCVSDGAAKDCETISVVVTEANTAPVLAAIGNQSGAELAALTFTATAADADVPAQTLTFSLAAGTAGAVPEGASITPGGAFTWTPTEAQGPGTYTFDVCVSDGIASDCETITVEVSEVNAAPSLATIGAKSTPELATLSFTATATDADVPAQTLTFSLEAGTAGAVPAGAVITTDGVFTWTPKEAQGPGSYTFDVCASDGTASDCETISVTVNEVNVAPVLSPIGSRSLDELTTWSFKAEATDTDQPAQSLTFHLAGGQAGYVPANASITAVGNFTFAPNEAQGPGTYTFDVCANDGLADTCETLVITVNEINVAPVIAETEPVNVSMSKNGAPQAFALTLHASDSDGQVLTWSILTPAGHGTAQASGSGDAKEIGYTPETDYTGSDSFVVQVEDTYGGKDSITVNVTIAVATFTISGGTGVDNATLTVSDGTTVMYGMDGTYLITVPYGWSGTVTPSKPGCTFDPASRSYTDVKANIENQFFNCKQEMFTISGNTGIDGAILKVTNNASVSYGPNGAYTLTVAYGWSGTITPSKEGYTFDPASRGYTTVNENKVDQDFTATQITYTLRGSVGVSGATLSFTGGTDVVSGADGSYEITVPYGWSGTVIPGKEGYTFDPASRTYAAVKDNKSAQDYIPTVIIVAISGNAGLDGVTLSYTGGTAVTSAADGSYTLTMPYGWSGTVTPFKAGYTFVPVSRSYASLKTDQSGQDYTAVLIPPTGGFKIFLPQVKNTTID